MSGADPRWARRKHARPSEIIEAASTVFIENGFAAAKLDEVARRAGVAKGTLYRYFDTKEALFRAVVEQAAAETVKAIEQAADGFSGPLHAFVPALLARSAAPIDGSRIAAILRIVISESQSFPDVARIWHDNVVARVLTVLTRLIFEAQGRGEIRPGDPHLHAFSILGPMVLGRLFRELFGAWSDFSPDLAELARQHADTVLRGLETSPREAK